MTAPAARGTRFFRVDLVAIAVLLFGIKLLVIGAFGTDLPFRDQWDAEARNLFIPYLEHGLWGVDWFAVHNVHRIVTTRLFALVLLVINGQWDALVECVFSAAVHVAGAVSLAFFVERQVAAGPARSVLVSVIVVGFAAPYGWENILSGFQCQFYFLLLATVVMLMIASAGRRTPGGYGCIVLLGAAAYFSLAGGIFSCVAAAACVAFVGATSSRGRLSAAQVVCIGMLLGIAVAGYVYTPKSESTGPVIAVTTAWLTSLHHSLSVPTTAGAALLWAPVVLLLYRTVREPRAASRLAVFALGLAFFVLMTDAGIASERGDDLASRYKDLQWLGLFANLMAIHVLTRAGRTPGKMAWKSASFTIYAIVVSGLLIDDGLRSLDEAGDRKARLEIGATHVAAFVRTNDAAAFESQADQLPHPSVALLELLLRNDAIRSVLPPSVRPGLLDAADAIAASDLRSPGSAPAIPDDRDSAAKAFGTYGLATPAGHLVSRPLAPPGTGPLAIRVIGTTLPGEATAGIASDGNRTDFPIRGIAADRWSTFVVSRPALPFVFSFAVDPRAATRWVAFSGPIEIGPLRRFCDLLLEHAKTIFAFGAAAFLLLQVGARSTARATLRGIVRH